MATNFFEIGKGGASRIKTVDYGRALDPIVDKVNKMAEESKAKTEALINAMPQGVPIDKVPEELRGQVTEFLAQGKQDYLEASKVIASGIRPTDPRYIDAMATINGVNNKFRSLSEQLEDVALKRQAALDNRDHSDGALDWEINDHESLANGGLYSSFQIQPDGTFNYTSSDGNVKSWSDYSNTFQKSNVGQEAYFNLEQMAKDDGRYGNEFNEKSYRNRFKSLRKGLKTDGGRDFLFSDEEFLEMVTGEEFGTEEYDNAVKVLRNQGDFEGLMNQYENYAIGELKKVHDLSYNSYQQRQNSNARSKNQYFLGNQYLTGPAADKVDSDVANINSSEDFVATSWNGVVYRRKNGELQVRDDGKFVTVDRQSLLQTLGGLSELEGIKPLEGPEFTPPPPVEEEQQEQKKKRKRNENVNIDELGDFKPYQPKL